MLECRVTQIDFSRAHGFRTSAIADQEFLRGWPVGHEWGPLCVEQCRTKLLIKAAYKAEID